MRSRKRQRQSSAAGSLTGHHEGLVFDSPIEGSRETAAHDPKSNPCGSLRIVGLNEARAGRRMVFRLTRQVLRQSTVDEKPALLKRAGFSFECERPTRVATLERVTSKHGRA